MGPSFPLKTRLYNNNSAFPNLIKCLKNQNDKSNLPTLMFFKPETNDNRKQNISNLFWPDNHESSTVTQLVECLTCDQEVVGSMASI